MFPSNSTPKASLKAPPKAPLKAPQSVPPTVNDNLPIASIVKLDSGKLMGVIDADLAGLLEDGIYFDDENRRIIVSMEFTPYLAKGGVRGKRGYTAILGVLQPRHTPGQTCHGITCTPNCMVRIPVSDSRAQLLRDAGKFRVPADPRKEPDGDTTDAAEDDIFE